MLYPPKAEMQFSQPANHYIQYSDRELEDMLEHHQSVSLNLQTELVYRHRDQNKAKPKEFELLFDLLQDTADEVNREQSLRTRASTSVNHAIELLTNKQSKHPVRLYAQFLENVMGMSSPGLALLCAAALGKRRILDLGTARLHLPRYLATAQSSLKTSHLESLAKDHGLLRLPGDDHVFSAFNTRLIVVVIWPPAKASPTKRTLDISTIPREPSPKRQRVDKASSQAEPIVQHRASLPVELQAVRECSTDWSTHDSLNSDKQTTERTTMGSQEAPVNGTVVNQEPLSNNTRTTSANTRTEPTQPESAQAEPAQPEPKHLQYTRTEVSHMEMPKVPSSNVPNSLTGEVYELSTEDICYLLDSGEMQSSILLTIPYHGQAPFITTTCSSQIAWHLRRQRTQLM